VDTNKKRLNVVYKTLYRPIKIETIHDGSLFWDVRVFISAH
jgi:hypothetical protein